MGEFSAVAESNGGDDEDHCSLSVVATEEGEARWRMQRGESRRDSECISSCSVISVRLMCRRVKETGALLSVFSFIYLFTYLFSELFCPKKKEEPERKSGGAAEQKLLRRSPHKVETKEEV